MDVSWELDGWPWFALALVFAVIFAILGESSLSFIGLGASGQLTLGTMLYYSQNASAMNMPFQKSRGCLISERKTTKRRAPAYA